MDSNKEPGEVLSRDVGRLQPAMVGSGRLSQLDQSMSLIDAATAIVELLDQYDCDADLSAAKSQLNAAVTAELLTHGGVIDSSPWRKRGPARRNDYAAIRAAVEANAKLPPDKRRSQDQLAVELGVSKPTIRKALRTT